MRGVPKVSRPHVYYSIYCSTQLKKKILNLEKIIPTELL